MYVQVKKGNNMNTAQTILEYKRPGEGDRWDEFPISEKLTDVHFVFYLFRIDGIEFLERTAQFDEMYGKILMWNQLSND